MGVRWCIKSSFIPLVGKLLPSDDIEVTKAGETVSIRFSVHKVKKFGYSRRFTRIVFDFAAARADCL